MSLQSEKKILETEIARYMTLLSNLSNPPTGYIENVGFFRGAVQTAKADEIGEMKATWQTIRPKDLHSARYIKTGKIGVN